MTQKTPTVYDDTLKQIRAAGPGEQVEISRIPISEAEGNELLANPDGLYYGRFPLPPTIYLDTVTGVDNIAAVKANPSTAKLKTLAYALQQIALARPSNITLLLKSGQSYALAAVAIESCDLTIATYDDPIYGLATGYLGASQILNCYHTNFTRAKITATFANDVNTGCWYIDDLLIRYSYLRCLGIQFDIPAAPGINVAESSYAVTSNMITLVDTQFGTNGCIVNKLSHDSKFGFFGVAPGHTSRYRQIATRFLSEGVALADDSNQTALANRKYFIKIMADVPPNNSRYNNYSMVPTGTGSLLPTGLLDFYWAVSYGGIDPANSANYQATFPAVDSTYGVRNYVYGVQRDLQGRPMNVRAPFLF